MPDNPPPACAGPTTPVAALRDFSCVRLRTARLDLRPLEPADAPELFRIYSDPDFMRYWSSPPWTRAEQAEELIADDLRRLAAGEHLRLGIVLRDAGRLIGTCSLFRIDAPCRRAEIGYGIAPDCWRRGFMREAVAALVDYAFSQLQLNRLEADVDPRNRASAASLEKLGFTLEGHLRERWIVAGEPSDSAIYGLLAADWRNRRTGRTGTTAGPPAIRSSRRDGSGSAA